MNERKQESNQAPDMTTEGMTPFELIEQVLTESAKGPSASLDQWVGKPREQVAKQREAAVGHQASECETVGKGLKAADDLIKLLRSATISKQPD